MYLQGAALKAAAENGFDSCLFLLASHPRVQVDFDDQFVLRWACMRGLTRSVALLLSRPAADPSVRESECVRWAARFGHVKVRGGRVLCFCLVCFFFFFFFCFLLICNTPQGS